MQPYCKVLPENPENVVSVLLWCLDVPPWPLSDRPAPKQKSNTAVNKGMNYFNNRQGNRDLDQ